MGRERFQSSRDPAYYQNLHQEGKNGNSESAAKAHNASVNGGIASGEVSHLKAVLRREGRVSNLNDARANEILHTLGEEELIRLQNAQKEGERSETELEHERRDTKNQEEIKEMYDSNQKEIFADIKRFEDETNQRTHPID